MPRADPYARIAEVPVVRIEQVGRDDDAILDETMASRSRLDSRNQLRATLLGQLTLTYFAKVAQDFYVRSIALFRAHLRSEHRLPANED
jgi:hypothetical protein